MQTPFDPKNPFFVVTYICRALLEFDRFTEAFEIIRTVCKLPLQKVQKAQDYFSDLNLLDLRCKFLMKDFEGVWASLAEGYSVTRSLAQLVRFKRFVGNFLLEQNLEVEFEKMIQESKKVASALGKRVQVNLSSGEFLQFDILIKFFEIRLQLRQLKNQFVGNLNNLNNYSLSWGRQGPKLRVDFESSNNWLMSPQKNIKRESCISNLQNTCKSIFATNHNPIKRQMTSITRTENANDSVKSFELENQVKILHSEEQFLEKLKSDQKKESRARGRQFEVIFQTYNIEMITKKLIDLTQVLFGCAVNFQKCKTQELVTELSRIVWDCGELVRLIPPFTSKIRQNLITSLWRLWAILENFELSLSSLRDTEMDSARHFAENKLGLIEYLGELLEDDFGRLFWTGQTKGETGKEQVYVRNLDVELILNHRQEAKFMSGKLHACLAQVIEASRLSPSLQYKWAKMEFWNQVLPIVWDKANLYDENQEDLLDGFFREDFRNLMVSYSISNSKSSLKVESRREDVKQTSLANNSNQLEASITIIESKQSPIPIGNQITSQLSFAQILSLPRGLWFKIQIRDSAEQARVEDLVSRYKLFLHARKLPSLLEQSLDFFQFKTQFLKNYLNFCFFERDIRLKSLPKRRSNSEQELFLGLSLFQDHQVKTQMFSVLKKVVSDDNQWLGLLRLLRDGFKPQVKGLLRRNFKFLRVFSPDEFCDPEADFGARLKAHQTEVDSKLELLRRILEKQSRVDSLIEDALAGKHHSVDKENAISKNKVKKKDQRKETQEDEPEVREGGLVVLLQFSPKKDAIWLGLRDLASSKCLVKVLKNEGSAYLGLKKIQLELENLKYVLKQSIFHSTKEFDALWEQTKRKIMKMQIQAASLLQRIEVIIQAFLKSLEIIKLRQLKVISTNRGFFRTSQDDRESPKRTEEAQKKTKEKQNQLKNLKSNTFKESQSEVTEAESLIKFDIKDFKAKMKRHLILCCDLEFLDVDFHQLSVFSSFQVIHKDLSLDTLLRRFTSEEGQQVLEDLQSVDKQLVLLREQQTKAQSSAKPQPNASSPSGVLQQKILDIFRSQGMIERSLTKDSGFFLAFNGKSKKNNLDYVKENNLEEQFSEGTISVNLGESLKRHFEGVDSAKGVIEINDLRKGLCAEGMLTIHSVEPSFGIIPWETLFNFFLTDKFVKIDSNQASAPRPVERSTDCHLELDCWSDPVSSKRCPILLLLDRIPFARKSFQKYPAIEKKFLLFNNTNYSKDVVLLLTFLGCPLVIVGKTNLPMQYHQEILDKVVGEMDNSFKSFQKLLSETKSLFENFFCFGISLKPILKTSVDLN